MFTFSSLSGIDHIARLVENKVTNDMFEDLNRVYTIVEVKEALDDMALGKSSGPNGMTVSFYRRY